MLGVLYSKKLAGVERFELPSMVLETTILALVLHPCVCLENFALPDILQSNSAISYYLFYSVKLQTGLSAYDIIEL